MIPSAAISCHMASNGDKETPVLLRADKAIPYLELLEVMNLLREAGYLKVALVVQASS